MKPLYKDTFSQVHYTGEIKVPEKIITMQTHKSRKKVAKRMLVVAAALTVTALCGVSAFAGNFFGLRDLILSEPAPQVVAEGSAASEIPEEDMTLLAVQGYADSNEYKAMQEWNAFTESYDQDETILNQVGNGDTGLDAKYDLYLVYSQEMADKLDEITAKYGLALHKTYENVDQAALIQSVGGDFLGTANTVGSAYIYDDGSFHVDGAAMLSSGTGVEYQFGNWEKGYFNDVMVGIDDTAEYEEWTYTTKSGQTVALSLGKDKSFINVDLEHSFVTVNILTGLEGGPLDGAAITKDDLQELADSFDFSMIP